MKVESSAVREFEREREREGFPSLPFPSHSTETLTQARRFVSFEGGVYMHFMRVCCVLSAVCWISVGQMKCVCQNGKSSDR